LETSENLLEGEEEESESSSEDNGYLKKLNRGTRRPRKSRAKGDEESASDSVDSDGIDRNNIDHRKFGCNLAEVDRLGTNFKQIVMAQARLRHKQREDHSGHTQMVSISSIPTQKFSEVD